jgi:hypothetical protein
MTSSILVVYDEQSSYAMDYSNSSDYSETTLSYEYHGYVSSSPIPSARFNSHYNTVNIDKFMVRGVGETLYLAVIVYSDGSTFGRTDGHHYIVGAYPTRDDASAAANKAVTEADYKPWEGYFSRFQGTEVIALDCLDE